MSLDILNRTTNIEKMMQLFEFINNQSKIPTNEKSNNLGGANPPDRDERIHAAYSKRFANNPIPGQLTKGSTKHFHLWIGRTWENFVRRVSLPPGQAEDVSGGYTRYCRVHICHRPLISVKAEL